MDRDLLIGRVVDQEASDADWRALHELADSDPGVWRDLARAQREQADLCAQVEGALACADGVDVPGHEHFSTSLTERVRVVTTWSGWLAAAAILLAWTGTLDLGALGGRGEAGAQLGEMVPIPANQPERALDYYLAEGRKQGFVVGELPERVVLDVVVDEEGADRGATVFYLRQIVEKTDGDTFQMLGTDELGRPDPSVRHPVRLREARPSRPQ